jgi:RimJ/RimL family protein N-acetyltransferase
MTRYVIRAVADLDLERVRAFLERHVETSLFLLSNLAVLGARLGEHPNSGNYRFIEEGGGIRAVFCLTRRGNLLVQAGGHAEVADAILHACRDQPIQICGVIGEWPTSEALWRAVRADVRLRPTHSSKDVLYRLILSGTPRSGMTGTAASRGSSAALSAVTVRALEPDDLTQWEQLNTDYLTELSLPLQTTVMQRKEDFVSRARARLWWGAFEGARLVAIAGLNATYGYLGQVGGVYTVPERRNRGLSRAAMRLLIQDSREYHRFERLTLFTGEDNSPARRLYESLGFESAGTLGLYLGERT